MYLKAQILLLLQLLTVITMGQTVQFKGSKIITHLDELTPKPINTNKSLGSKKIQYFDQHTLIGYNFTKNPYGVMNRHPEIGIGFGYKKDNFTTGIHGAFRFLKTKEPYNYFILNDTQSTRYFSNLAFSFYFYKPFYNNNGHEVFLELAPGFEILYVEKTAKTFTQNRAYAVSSHLHFSLGYRYTKPNLNYYQWSVSTNYNNFSYGKSTNIPSQIYFNIQFAFGFIKIDEWATKKNFL